MKALILVFIIFLFHTRTYSQNEFQNMPGGKSIDHERENIDNLNKGAQDIFLSHPDSAHNFAAKALLLYEKLNDSLRMGRSFFTLGTIYWSQSYYPISLFYLKSSLGFLPKKYPLFLSDSYKALARTYCDLKECGRALVYLDTALYFAGTDTERQAQVFSERSSVYTMLRNYSEAITTADYSLKLNKSIGALRNVAVLYGKLGTIYTKKKNYARALAYDDTSYKMAVKLNNERLMAFTDAEYAQIYNDLGQFDKAISFAEKGIALSVKIGVMDATARSYDAIVESYVHENELKKAVALQKKYNLLKDSISTSAKLKTIELVQNYYNLNSKMNSVELMRVNERNNKAKIGFQHILIRVLVLSLIILVALLTATFFFYKQKNVLSNKLQQQHKALLNQKQLIEAQTINLQTLNDLKDKLLAVIGHDLRTPISDLSNILEMFENNNLTAKEVNDLMKIINPMVKGAQLTLTNLLAWAGSNIGGKTLHSTNVDLFLLGAEMGQTFEHSLSKKNIHFINNTNPGQQVFADENHLKVILRNLISNAIKFTGSGGSITLLTKVVNNELIISITDTGMGMKAEEIERLFYLNTHFSNFGTSGEKGTGIGLLLCKELVELNGGKLNVTSSPGKGSTFFFNLALAEVYANG